MLRVVASVDVECDDELTIAYVDENASTASRQHLLGEDYHFQCGCKKCAQ